MSRTALAFLVCCLTSAQAATEWTYGSSDHFEVFTTGNAGKARDALNYFERIHAFYSDVLKTDPQLKAPTRIILFSNEKEYAPYRPNEGTFAFYQPGPDRDYIVMQSLSAEVYPVVVHEYMHLIVRHVTSISIPVWLNEGWADFYSTIEPQAGKMAVGKHSPQRLYQLTSGARILPLDKLFAITHNSPEYNDTKLMGDFYAESWALVHMLLSDPKYRPKSPEFLQLMLNGGDSATSLTKAFGKPVGEIEKDMRSYIRGSSYLISLFDYKSPKPRKDLEIRLTTNFEGALVTANLQAISRRSEAEARAAFAALEKENEAHLELQESLAIFEYRHGHPEAALPHFARAAELGSESWQFYRDYAYATQDEAKRAEVLGHAVRLNDNDLDLRLRYSNALLRVGRYAQALAALVPVKRVDKEHAYLFFQMAATANAQNQNWEETKTAAGRALPYAETPAQRDYIERLIKSANSQIEYAAAMKNRDAATATAARPTRLTSPDDLGERPRLTRAEPRPEPQELSAEEIAAIERATGVNGAQVFAEAKFDKLDCSAAEPVMEFTTAQGTLRLSMEHPDSILLKGAAAATIELNCGDQKGKPVRVGYNMDANTKKRTVGEVRVIEFQ